MNSPLQSRIPAAPETFPGIFWCPDLVTTRDLGPQGVQAVLHLAELMKSRPSVFQRSLAGQTVISAVEIRETSFPRRREAKGTTLRMT